MPVFVEWQWKERTKTLLTIFHFYDDFSKRNLRLMKLDNSKFFSPEGNLELKRDWVSWAPSHPEMALLMQLLGYANIINGLKESEKRRLKAKLEGVTEMEESDTFYIQDFRKDIGKDKKTVVYVEHGEPVHLMHCCIELCPEYIDYLKKVLKPYLKD